MKMGNNHGKTQPPESPFVKGDLKNNGKYFSMKRGILREYKDIKKSVGKRLVFSMQCFFYFGRV